MSKEQIDLKISTLEGELLNAKGTECEVYARIVGYYRSVRNWNAGKTEEYLKRVNFSN